MKAVFLDRDGTINIDVGYLSDPGDFVFIRGAREAVETLKKKGFKIFVITNQSGVGRGYFSKEDLEAVNKKMSEEFEKGGVKLDGIYSCVHRSDEQCDCRKPNPSVVLKLAKKHKIDLKNSYFIGDKLTDVKTGFNAGCKTVLVSTGENVSIEEEEDWIQPDFLAEDLQEAVEWIVGEK